VIALLLVAAMTAIPAECKEPDYTDMFDVLAEIQGDCEVQPVGQDPVSCTDAVIMVIEAYQRQVERTCAETIPGFKATIAELETKDAQRVVYIDQLENETRECKDAVRFLENRPLPKRRGWLWGAGVGAVCLATR
jgi:hypothetical protein